MSNAVRILNVLLDPKTHERLKQRAKREGRSTRKQAAMVLRAHVNEPDEVDAFRRPAREPVSAA